MNIINFSLARGTGPSGPAGGRRYQPPALPADLVARSGLIARLDGPPGRICVVHGPPGSGKSVLLASHHAQLQAQGLAVQWLNLTSEDNQPEVLRRHLARAFPGGSVEPAADEPGELPGGVVAYIDNLERVTDPSARELLEWFLLGLPGDSRLLLASQQSPGALLQQARLQGRLDVIDPTDLRMDTGAAQQLLGSAHAAEAAVRLHGMVAGWAAGLRMLAQDVQASMRLLACADGQTPLPDAMHDYLDAVVCAKLPATRLQGLRELGTLGRVCPGLMAAIEDLGANWALVEDLRRQGWLVNDDTTGRDWAWLHPALARHLDLQLRRSHPARHAQLHQRAAQWCAANGQPGEVMRHAVAIGQPGQAAHLVERAGAINIDLADGPDLYLQPALTAEQASALPLLFLSQVYQWVRRGHTLQGQALFDRACELTDNFRRIDPGADAGHVRSWVEQIRMVFVSNQDRRIDPAHVQVIQEALDDQLPRHTVLAISLASVLAYCHVQEWRYRDALTLGNVAMQVHPLANADKAAIFLRLHQGFAALASTSLSQATEYIEDAQRLALRHCHGPSYEVLSTQMMRAVLHYENNEPELAMALLEPALRNVRSINGWLTLHAEAFCLAADIAGQMHGLDAAERFIAAGEAYAHERDWPRLLVLMQVARIRQLTAAGEWRQAMALGSTARIEAVLDSTDRHTWQQAMQLPALQAMAQLSLALGRPRDALQWLERSDADSLQRADNRLRLEQQLLLMRAQHALRRGSSAQAHMVNALEIIHASGLQRRLQLALEPLRSVHAGMLVRGQVLPPRLAHYGALLRAEPGSGVAPPTAPRTCRGGNLMLSPRESDTIALMAEGCSNKEIAKRLGISEGTVKTHRKKIHEKLGVSSRSQAIQRARELLIL